MASGDIIRIGGGFDRTQYNHFGYNGNKTGSAILVNINGEGYISVFSCRLGGSSRIKLTVDGVLIFDVNNTNSGNANVGFMTVYDYTGGTIDGASRIFSTTLPIIFSGDPTSSSSVARAILPSEVLFKNSVKLELISGNCSYEFAGGIK